ncbi:MAG: hypothetical protein HGB06_05230 [Chlorobaculum sp.]|jgi:hypothetical protein|nr:hypothetical protein [Chlorobaculum sp.]
MNTEILKIVGQIAGIGGLALGVLFLLFRDLLKQIVAPAMTKSQWFRVVVIFMLLVWSIAVIGIGAWVYAGVWGTKQNDPARASPSVIRAGQNIIAGHDIVVNVSRYPYLEDKYEMEGMLRDGWYGQGPPNELINSQKEDLAIYPVGLANHRLGFLVSSTSHAHIKVERLYLKLNAYATCDLRDETTEILGFMGVTTAAFFISEDYNIYPIYPMNTNLEMSSWIYKGKDINEFRVYLAYRPYVLYLISINIDYLDLNRNEMKHVESDEFSLIEVAHGNWGGCLDIKRWFSRDMQREPKSANYDERIPYDIYQLLTADFSYNPGMMNVFLTNRNLIRRSSEVKAIIESRPDNTLFRDNYEAWAQALQGTK